MNLIDRLAAAYRATFKESSELPEKALRALGWYVDDACMEDFVFALIDVPTEVLKFLVTTENADIAFDHGNFPDYHRWYVGSWDREKSISEYVDGFPCIISDGEDVFDDGWHRFHAYVSRGNLTTPCLLLRHKLRPESAA